MARILDKTAQRLHRNLEENRCNTLSYNEPDVFHADKILDVRAITTEVEYLVKWKGYSSKFNEWVSEKNVGPQLRRSFSRERKKTELKRLQNEKKKLHKNRQADGTVHLKIKEKPSATTTSRTSNILSFHGTAEQQTAFPIQEPELQVSMQEENAFQGTAEQQTAFPIQEPELQVSMQEENAFQGTAVQTAFPIQETELQVSTQEENAFQGTAVQTAFPIQEPELQVSTQEQNFSEVSSTSECVISTAGTIQETMQRSSVQILKQFDGNASDADAESQPKNECLRNEKVPQEIELQYLIGFDESMEPVYE